MCGLVGLVNKNINGFTNGQQEVFNSLLFLDYFRGMDSTGVFLVDNRGDIALAKEASNPIDFMSTPQYNELMKRSFSRGSALIGHNRKATRGVVNDENAHPFVVDDKIVLVHNGTMYGDHKKIADVEVDSHAIAHAIHEKKDVTAALSSFDAAYALIWYDFENGTMNFIRNNARPLWWMETYNSWIWSSEKAMLEFVRQRHNLSVSDGPAELPEDTHQIFTLNSNGGWKAKTDKLSIKKQYAVVQQSFVTHNRSQRHHMQEDAWLAEYDNFQDPPFRPNPVVVQQFPTSSKYEELIKFEANEIAKKNNKIVTNAQFHSHVLEQYKYGADLYAKSFDYGYANLENSSEGYWLYLEVVDDPDVIIKFFFSDKHMDENRIVQIAGGEYIYKLKVATRRWDTWSRDRSAPTTPGYCVLTSDKATLIYGGGTGDSEWYTKAIKERTTH